MIIGDLLVLSESTINLKSMLLSKADYLSSGDPYIKIYFNSDEYTVLSGSQAKEWLEFWKQKVEKAKNLDSPYRDLRSELHG